MNEQLLARSEDSSSEDILPLSSSSSFLDVRLADSPSNYCSDNTEWDSDEENWDDTRKVVKRGKSKHKLKSKASTMHKSKAGVKPKISTKRPEKVEWESDVGEYDSENICKVVKIGEQKLKSKVATKHKKKAHAKPKSSTKRPGKTDVSSLLKILNRVFNSLANSCGDIVSVYAATTPDDAYSPVLLCLTTVECHHLPATFKGFIVIQKAFYPTSTESLLAENYDNEKFKYDTKTFKEIDDTINYHAESLMMKHTNLEVIKMSLFRSSKDGVIHEPCIVLLCRCKSYIPFGESEFPRELRHPTDNILFPTDVREGYFEFCSSLTRSPSEWNKELAMGCSIGPENDGFSASLGPFINVKETNELCFLTVRHLFQPLDQPDRLLSGVNVVQPADSDYSVGNQSWWNCRRCGVVKVAEMNNIIDAALMKIHPARAPSRGNFVGIQSDDLQFAGFSESSFPSYDDGCVRDARTFLGQDYAHDRVIKFGKQTGLTKGAIQIRNMVVRLRDGMGHIQIGSQIQRRVLCHQLQVESFARKLFFEKGDSGSAVFSVDNNNKLYCIGMAVGVTSDHTCIVTPIQNILQRLGQKLGQTLELKAFPSERMDY